MSESVPVELCPDPSVHGHPFRYCPFCEWREEQDPKPAIVTPSPDDERQVDVARQAALDALPLAWTKRGGINPTRVAENIARAVLAALATEMGV